MNKETWYWLNDEWVHINSLPDPDRCNEGGFESIFYSHHCMPLFMYHYQRLEKGLLSDYGLSLLPPPSYLQEIIHLLVDKNEFEQGCKIRVRVYKYEMEEAWNLQLEAVPLPYSEYLFNEIGWQVGLWEVESTQLHRDYKHQERSIYLAASTKAKSNQMQDLLLKDAQGRILESSIGNIFFFKNGAWHTPPLDNGGIPGIMRGLLIELLQAKEEQLFENELREIEELFICNAIRGVVWVERCGDVLWKQEETKMAYTKLAAWQKKSFA